MQIYDEMQECKKCKEKQPQHLIFSGGTLWQGAQKAHLKRKYIIMARSESKPVYQSIIVYLYPLYYQENT